MTNYTVGDLEPPLAGTCTDAGTPVSLASADTVAVHIRRPDGTTISRVPSLANQTTSPGAWSLPWETGDLPSRGTYNVEVQATWPGGRPQTFTGPLASFQVRDQIA